MKSRRTRGAAGQLSVLDLYSGCGGLSLGFELTGAFRVIAGMDKFEWAVESFHANHPKADRAFNKPLDIGALSPSSVVSSLGERPDVIVGGPPCQGFSKAGKRTGVDPRNMEVWNFLKMVREIQPAAFVMENVDGLLTTGQSERGELAGELQTEFESCGYVVSKQLLDAVNYNVPQRRKRIVIVGIRDSRKPFLFPDALSPEVPTLLSRGRPIVTVSDALGDMPSPTADNPQSYAGAPKTWLQRFLRHESDGIYEHSQTHHGADMVARLTAQKCGTRLYPNWNHSWYRLDPSRPSPTVKENHRAPFVHFSEPRCTSPRECARLQTFPDRYRILGTKTAQLIQVGNAVPALLAAAVATALAKALGEERRVTSPNGVPPWMFDMASSYLPYDSAVF